MGTTVLVDGLAFAEGPRWRHGRLYFSDVAADEVLSVDMAGGLERVAEVEGGPSGLGWLPDGTMLIVRSEPAAVLALSLDGGLRTHADLSGLASFPANDMVVDSTGRAFVGCCDIAGIATGAPSVSELLCVLPDGTVSVVDAEMRFPNGSVVTPDGTTLIVAETFGQGLAAFALDGDAIGPKRAWATVAGSIPDGICLDAEGAVWFADPLSRAAVRVREGGEVLDRVETENGCFACTLGGDDGRTLFLLTGQLVAPEQNRKERIGQIETTLVEVPGAGSP
ncbi:MAG TPA: SMP-30/gluconolactonase/LRE family protein [Acidimicrobiales bacterium]|jgi:sugar lactone lactonase YvrE|nr:SMP-30/gluconolactonase/LRE family protein [Acidimicrobiales bacterium]